MTRAAAVVLGALAESALPARQWVARMAAALPRRGREPPHESVLDASAPPGVLAAAVKLAAQAGKPARAAIQAQSSGALVQQAWVALGLLVARLARPDSVWAGAGPAAPESTRCGSRPLKGWQAADVPRHCPVAAAMA